MSCQQHPTFQTDCTHCLQARVRLLEDSMQRIGRMCLHMSGALIWEEVKVTVGEHGEKRVTK